jgi:hypothetical protein
MQTKLTTENRARVPSSSMPANFLLAQIFEHYSRSIANTSLSSEDRFNFFAGLDMSTSNFNTDLTNEQASIVESSVKTPLRCTFPGCPEDREFFTHSALRYVRLHCLEIPRCTDLWLSENTKANTPSSTYVSCLVANILASVTKGVSIDTKEKSMELRRIAVPFLHAGVTRKASLGSTISSSIRNGAILAHPRLG